MFILLTEIYINSNHYREKNSWKINLINFVRHSSPQKPLIWWICKLRSFLNREFTVTVLFQIPNHWHFEFFLIIAIPFSKHFFFILNSLSIELPLQPLVFFIGRKKDRIDKLRYLHFYFIRKWFLTSLFCIIVQHDTHIWQGRPFSRRTRAITHRTSVHAQSQLILCSRLAFVRNQKCRVHWLHARWTNKAPH